MQAANVKLGKPTIKHTYKAANALAKEGAKKKVFGRPAMLIVPPVYIIDVFWTDILGTTNQRLILTCNNTSTEALVWCSILTGDTM